MTQIEQDEFQEFATFEAGNDDSFSSDWFEDETEKDVALRLPHRIAKIPNISAFRSESARKGEARRFGSFLVKTTFALGIFALGVLLGMNASKDLAREDPVAEEKPREEIDIVETTPTQGLAVETSQSSLEAFSVEESLSDFDDNYGLDAGQYNDKFEDRDSLYADLDDVSFSAPTRGIEGNVNAAYSPNPPAFSPNFENYQPNSGVPSQPVDARMNAPYAAEVERSTNPGELASQTQGLYDRRGNAEQAPRSEIERSDVPEASARANDDFERNFPTWADLEPPRGSIPSKSLPSANAPSRVVANSGFHGFQSYSTPAQTNEYAQTGAIRSNQNSDYNNKTEFKGYPTQNDSVLAANNANNEIFSGNYEYNGQGAVRVDSPDYRTHGSAIDAENAYAHAMNSDYNHDDNYAQTGATSPNRRFASYGDDASRDLPANRVESPKFVAQTYEERNVPNEQNAQTEESTSKTEAFQPTRPLRW